MKYLVLALTLVGSTALAMPKVGDYASLGVAINGTSVGTVENELTQFNGAQSKFLQITTQTVSGTRTVSQQWTDGVTDALINTILTNCAQNHGTVQSVTVPAGTFNTCALPVSQNGSTGTMWVGFVPFGIVKADVVNGGTHIVEDLVSYKMGQ